MGSWSITNTVSVRGPYAQTCAIVIKLRSGDGAVRFFSGDQDLGDCQTGPEAEDKVIMVLLPPKQSCWVIRDALTKFIEGLG